MVNSDMQPSHRLQSVLESLQGVRALVIGDLMLDHYIWGDVHRISPEAPVPVLLARRDTFTAGGAANVALNLMNLGVRTTILGWLSDDEAGVKLRSLLAAEHAHCLPVSRSGNPPTIVKTRVMARGQQVCRIDREAAPQDYCLYGEGAFLEVLDAALSQCDAVILSDYAKGVVTQSLVDHVLLRAREKATLLTAMDPKPSRQLAFQGIGLLTPNQSEALQLAGFNSLHPDDVFPLAEVCRRIHEKYAPALLVVTLGADGMAVSTGGKVTATLPTHAREVFDVSGAGDTVISTLTAALAAGADPVEAATLANVAAGCVVAHMGTVAVRRLELEASLSMLGANSE